MIKKLLLPIAAFALSFQVQAQRTCSSHEHWQNLKALYPSIEQEAQKIEKHTQLFEQNGANQKAGTVYYIPVVVHVVYNTTTENVSDAQIQSQITALNADFRRLNADKSNTPSTFSGVASDVEIEFCLATVDASGAATTGIVRKSTTVTTFSDNDAMKSNSTGGSTAWPADKYMNLWVCDLGSSLLGYAQFPGGPASTDGVVINYKYFGTTGTATAPFNKGRTATHEVGHWLNLRHIWGDASCGSDLVSDTPTHATDNGGCPSHPKANSCGTSAEMFMNYMDYTDDACMNMFSAGQTTRMRALFASGGSKASLLTSGGCGGGTTTTPSYCSSAASDTQYEFIKNVTFSNVNNTTTIGGGYNNYTSLTANVNKGSAYTVTLTPGFASTAYAEFFNVYIDYNGDKDFTDAGENVVASSAGSTSAVSASITIPSTALTGTTRMRVIMKDAAVANSCEAFTYGEVEDYSINIQAAATASCGTPSGLTYSSVTSSSATVSWAAVSGASSYAVRYRVSGTTTWSNTTSTTTSKSLSGLSASTTYEYQVQAVCSGTGGSYSASATVKTSAATATTSTMTVGTGTSTTGVAPYGTYYMDERVQFIITKDELVAAGYNAVNNKLRSLGFYVTTANSQTMNGFTIKIAHTTSSSFSSTSFLSGIFTSVYSANFTPTASSWNTHTFSTAYSYDGSSNLLIDICWNNSTYNNNTSVQYTATSSYRALSYRADNATSGVCTNTTGTRTYNRPNIRLTSSSSATKEIKSEETIAEESTEEITSTAFEATEVMLFPNPTNSNVNISFAVNKDQSDVTLNIYNTVGTLVYTLKQTGVPSGVFTHQMNMLKDTSIPELSNGIYICNVNVGGEMISRRFVLNR